MHLSRALPWSTEIPGLGCNGCPPNHNSAKGFTAAGWLRVEGFRGLGVQGFRVFQGGRLKGQLQARSAFLLLSFKNGPSNLRFWPLL